MALTTIDPNELITQENLIELVTIGRSDLINAIGPMVNNDMSVAEDLFQEACVLFLQDTNTPTGHAPLSKDLVIEKFLTYLHGLVKLYNKSGIDGEGGFTSLPGVVSPLYDDKIDLDISLLSAIPSHQIKQGFESLKKLQQDCLVLFLQGNSLEEINVIMSIDNSLDLFRQSLLHFGSGQTNSPQDN